MEMPINCSGCGEVVELNSTRACHECGLRDVLRCDDCHRAHGRDEHPEDSQQGDGQ